MKVKIIIAIVIVVVVGIWAFNSFTDSLTAYVSFDEAQQCGARVQVMGEIDHQNVHYDIEKQVLHFTISDEQGNRMNALYAGTVPGNFQQASHVVCLGKYDGTVFQADQLLVKCPSKYQGEEG